MWHNVANTIGSRTYSRHAQKPLINIACKSLTPRYSTPLGLAGKVALHCHLLWKHRTYTIFCGRSESSFCSEFHGSTGTQLHTTTHHYTPDNIFVLDGVDHAAALHTCRSSQTPAASRVRSRLHIFRSFTFFPPHLHILRYLIFTHAVVISCIMLLILNSANETPSQLQSTILTLISSIVQIVALVWYLVSYFPMGSTGLRFAARFGTSRITSWMNE